MGRHPRAPETPDEIAGGRFSRTADLHLDSDVCQESTRQLGGISEARSIGNLVGLCAQKKEGARIKIEGLELVHE